MDRRRISQLLMELGRRLSARDIRADIFVVGGSALALAYNARRSTSDIDAIIRPAGPVLEVARAMADELGLEPNWLSEGVVDTIHGLRADPEPLNWTEGASASSVRVRVGSPQFLLAMKAMTTRRSTVDLEDAAFLANLLDIRQEEQLAQLVADFWGTTVAGSQELFFEDIVERAEQLRARGTNPNGSVARTRCEQWMPRARRNCSLPVGHVGQHR